MPRCHCGCAQFRMRADSWACWRFSSISDMSRPVDAPRDDRKWPLPLPLASGGPVQHDLAGIAALHGGKAAVKILDGKPVRDHLAHVEAALQHAEHLVPRLEHLAPIDALDREHLEHDP